MGTPLATAQDVADIWRPLSDAEDAQAQRLIDKASARLRRRCRFDLDAAIATYDTSPTDPSAIDPLIVADVVAGMVKRAMVNPDGATSVSDTEGPFSRTRGFGGQGNQPTSTVVVFDSDIDALRPAQPTSLPGTIYTRPERCLGSGLS